MNTEICQSSCSWCRLSKEKKGLVVGILGAVLIHGVALGAVIYFGSDRIEAKRQPGVIYLGTITISPDKKRRLGLEDKRPKVEPNFIIALKRSI